MRGGETGEIRSQCGEGSIERRLIRSVQPVGNRWVLVEGPICIQEYLLQRKNLLLQVAGGL